MQQILLNLCYLLQIVSLGDTSKSFLENIVHFVFSYEIGSNYVIFASLLSFHFKIFFKKSKTVLELQTSIK